MEVLFASCPMCGARLDKTPTSRHVICDYCGAQFVLSKKEAEALGIPKDGKARQDVVDEREPERDDSNLSMREFARDECSKFYDRTDQDDFEDTSKIRRGLDIGNEEVFLIHDDTLFKSGKNGFAITEDGFVCKELLGDGLQRVSWDRVGRADEPRKENSTIYLDDVAVVYFTSNNNILDDLYDLVCRLARHARK